MVRVRVPCAATASAPRAAARRRRAAALRTAAATRAHTARTPWQGPCAATVFQDMSARAPQAARTATRASGCPRRSTAARRAPATCSAETRRLRATRQGSHSPAKPALPAGRGMGRTVSRASCRRESPPHPPVRERPLQPPLSCHAPRRGKTAEAALPTAQPSCWMPYREFMRPLSFLHERTPLCLFPRPHPTLPRFRCRRERTRALRHACDGAARVQRDCCAARSAGLPVRAGPPLLIHVGCLCGRAGSAFGRRDQGEHERPGPSGTHLPGRRVCVAFPVGLRRGGQRPGVVWHCPDGLRRRPFPARGVPCWG